MGFRRTLTVFMGSPGDLPDERDAVQATVEEVNRIIANRNGFHLDLVRWEDSAPGYGNPQERLNQDLDRADLFIGLLNRKLGSPISPDIGARTGFEEEYRRSLARRQKSGVPELMVLFRVVPEEILRDAGPDLRKVLAFRQELDGSKPVFYKTFNDAADLQGQVRSYLSTWIHNLRDADYSGRDDQPEVAPELPAPAEGEQPVFTAAGAAFLAGIAAERRQNGQLSPVETARLRLLGALLHTSANDSGVLGVHDANLLYSDQGHETLGPDEIRGLITAGLAHYRNKTAPLWGWLLRRGGEFGAALSDAAILQSETAERAGALAALETGGLELKGTALDRRRLVTVLLDPGEQPPVRAALLSYLAAFGVADDLPYLRAALADGLAGQAEETVTAILDILSRVDGVQAFRDLLDLGPSSPPAPLIHRIFSVADTVPQTWLIEAFGHRAPRVRIAALRASERLGVERTNWARSLTRDDDADVRAAAVETLEASGERLSPDYVRGILVRSGRNALWPFGISKPAGQLQWTAWRRRTHRGGSEELRLAAALRDRDPNAMLDLAGADRDLEVLRTVVDQAGEVDIPALWPADARIPAFKHLSEDESLALYGCALDRLAAVSEPADLTRVRTAFADTRLDLPESSYRFLGGHGDWSDAVRISTASEERRGSAPITMLSIKDRSDEYRWAAEALLTLGQEQWERLLSLPAGGGVIRRLLSGPSQKAWASFGTPLLLGLISAPNEAVRQRAVWRCIRDLPVKRLRLLLEAFQALPEHRYYATIHWLDFGISVPRAVSVAAARRLLDATD